MKDKFIDQKSINKMQEESGIGVDSIVKIITSEGQI
jgi:hypothetical protein